MDFDEWRKSVTPLVDEISKLQEEERKKIKEKRDKIIEFVQVDKELYDKFIGLGYGEEEAIILLAAHYYGGDEDEVKATWFWWQLLGGDLTTANQKTKKLINDYRQYGAP